MTSLYENDHTIELSVSTSSPRFESTADDVIQPGFLVNFTGNIHHCEPHSGTNEAQPGMFAVEDVKVGMQITDEYKLSERVIIRVPRRGDVVLAWFTENSIITVGSPLSSAGNGMLRPLAIAVGIPGALVGYAAEDITTIVGEFSRIKIIIA